MSDLTKEDREARTEYHLGAIGKPGHVVELSEDLREAYDTCDALEGRIAELTQELDEATRKMLAQADAQITKTSRLVAEALELKERLASCQIRLVDEGPGETDV